MMSLSDDELRTALRRSAAGHRPDRTAMLNRIARHRAAPPVAARPRGQAWRLAGSALAVASVLGIGGITRWALADSTSPDLTPVAPPAATSTTPPVAPSTAAPATRPPATTRPPASRRPAGPPPPPAATTTGTVAPKDTGVEQGPLWSDGSIAADGGDNAGLSIITLKVREPLRALDVTVRVAVTDGLTDQGATHDVTGATIDTTVVREQGTLVYHFKLHAGDTLAKGTHAFVAKYVYDEDDGRRDAGGDTYRATATTSGGTELSVHGDFRATG